MKNLSSLSPTELARELAPLLGRKRIAMKQASQLPEAVKGLSKAKRNRWLSAFDAAVKEYGAAKDAEAKAFSTAWTALGSPTGRQLSEKELRAPTDDYLGRMLHEYELSNGSRRLMLFPRGTFTHPEYGEMKFDDAFFADIVQNFTDRVLGETKPFVDVDHDHGAACAWIEGLSVEPDGLYANVRWTSLGEDLVKSGQYRYFSPWWGSYKDPGSGKTYDRVLRGGALTNIPFLKVLAAVELYEPGKQSAARTKAFATGVSFQLAELVATSLPPGVGGSQAAGMIRLAFNEQFCPRLSQMPISHPVWISEIYPDHVIAAHDTGPGYALTYFALPFTNEADGITFHPDRQVEVQQVWQAVETSHEYSEEALTHVRQERGPGAALAVLLADRREAAVLRALTAHERG